MSLTLNRFFANKREIQGKIGELVVNLKNKDSAVCNEIISDISYLCEDIRDNILESEKDDKSTDVQNNGRRIRYATELCFEISSAYENFVDILIKSIVSDLLSINQLQNICRKIVKRQRSDLYEKKFFLQAALNKLSLEKTRKMYSVNVSGTSAGTIQLRPYDISHENPLLMNEMMSVYDNEEENRDGTEMRGEQSTQLSASLLLVEEKKDELGSMQANTVFLDNPIDVNTISQVQFSYEHLPKIRKPDKLMESAQMNTGKQNIECTLEMNDETQHWEFEELTPLTVKKEKKKPLIIDDQTRIPNYAARALQLNERSQTDRVLVYKGPPQVVQSMSVNHLMSTPSFRKSFRPDRRNSGVAALFNRHLIVEERNHEAVMTTINDGENTSLRNDEPVRMQMQTFALAKENTPIQRSLVQPQPQQPRSSGSTLYGRSVLVEDLVGEPMSQFHLPIKKPVVVDDLPQTLPAPEWERKRRVFRESNCATRKKLKEYEHIVRELEKIWLLQDIQQSVKKITVKDFLKEMDDFNTVNYLTLVKVLDKLSLNRQLLLLPQNDDFIIVPFKVPHLTQKQIKLRGNYAKFCGHNLTTR